MPQGLILGKISGLLAVTTLKKTVPTLNPTNTPSMMNCAQGEAMQYKKVVVRTLQVLVVVVIVLPMVLQLVYVLLVKDKTRAAKVGQMFYELVLDRRAPAPPQNLRPNYGDLAEPKTRVFAAPSGISSGMGYDARQRERGK